MTYFEQKDVLSKYSTKYVTNDNNLSKKNQWYAVLEF